MKSFGASCRKKGLNVNGKTIFDILVNENILQESRNFYKGQYQKVYRLTPTFRCLTYYATEKELKNIPSHKVDGKMFVQIERIFDPWNKNRSRPTVFLTEKGAEKLFEYLAQKY